MCCSWWLLHRKHRPNMLLAYIVIFILPIHQNQAVDCPVSIGGLKVLENPIDVPKTANTKITTLQIQEQQYFGSLTCHVLRDTSNSIFNHFNATTRGLAFSNADTYDPYNFGKKREKFYNCDIYLTDSDFPDLAVDLEIVLILQPLLRRQSINVCDVPLITRQTVHIEFAEGHQDSNKVETKISTSSRRPPSSPTATNQFVTGLSTILRRTSFRIEDNLVTEASTSSTKRKPKLFFTSTSKNPFGSYQEDLDGGGSRQQQPQLVDGFDVGVGGGHGEGGKVNVEGGNDIGVGDAGNPGSDGGNRGGRGDLVDGSNPGSSGSNGGGIVGGNNNGENGPNVGTKNDEGRPSRVLQTNQDPTTSSSVLKDQGGYQTLENNGESEVENSKPIEVSNAESNTLLFWAILGIIVLLAFLFILAVIYYCCPALCVPCLGEGYLNKSFGSVGHPLGTAKDLTFVSVLDKNGQPLRHASSVEVWNTKKNNVRSYPIVKGEQEPNYNSQYGDADLRPHDFVLTDDFHHTATSIEAGDRVTLVDREGKESPVLVRILRAVTPRTFSARLARSRWKNHQPPPAGAAAQQGHFSTSSSATSAPRPPRIFEIVQEQQDGYFSASRGRKDVQILTLDGQNKETFRQEGDAEILELEEEALAAGTDVKKLPPARGVESLSILDEADEDLIRSELASAEAAEAASNNELMASIARKESEQQTDITYGQSNKKIQVTNTLDDQNSDVDEDVETTSSVLSQSLRSTHSNGGGDPSRYYRYKDRRAPHPLDEVGFLNVAMHHLVQDEFQAKHRPNGVAPGGNLGGNAEASNSLKRGRSQSQIDYFSDGSEGRYIVTRRRSKNKRSDGSINYYDGNRTPSPSYTETKASILRRRKNQKPNENEGEDLLEAFRSSNDNNRTTLRNYASLQDLSGLQQLSHHNEGVPFSKHSSTTSLHQNGGRRPTEENSKATSSLKRQNSEPLGVQI